MLIKEWPVACRKGGASSGAYGNKKLVQNAYRNRDPGEGAFRNKECCLQKPAVGIWLYATYLIMFWMIV